jgi:Tol biopolymer transport system component
MATRAATTVLGLMVMLLASACGSSSFHPVPVRKNGPLYLLRLGPVKEGIYRRDPNGSLTRLTFSRYVDGPGVSPHGDRIAFFRRDHLYLMRPDGSDVRRVDHLDPFSGPSWAPDERQFVYSELNGLWVARADGTGKRQLTHAKDGADRSPSWSPDGKTIVFSRVGRRSSLFTIHPDGSGLEKFLTAPPSSDTSTSFHFYTVSHPGWSPDGSKIAYLQTDLGRLMTRFPAAIEVVDRHGNDRREIAKVGDDGSCRFTWSPDAKWIAYYDDLRFPNGPRSHFAGI